MRKVFLFLIKLYQKTLSYDHGFLGKIFPNTRHCRFVPTCSEYMYEAVQRYGVFQGIKLGINRLLRCNTKTPVGIYDPVPENK